MQSINAEYVPTARKNFDWNRQLVKDDLMHCLGYNIVPTPKAIGDLSAQRLWAMDVVNKLLLQHEMQSKRIKAN